MLISWSMIWVLLNVKSKDIIYGKPSLLSIYNGKKLPGTVWVCQGFTFCFFMCIYVYVYMYIYHTNTYIKILIHLDILML